MKEYMPVLILAAVIGSVSAALILAYVLVKDKKEAMGFDRKIKDSELIKRLLVYAKPYWKSFVLVGLVMVLGISYSIVSPILVSKIQELVKASFQMKTLLTMVAIYGGLLIVSLVGSYVQAVLLQVTGQKIVSGLREDLFCRIESLSHGQLGQIPVGKLVTRVTNDTAAISMMFTGLLANLVQNVFIVAGVLVAMFVLNVPLTLLVLSFTPFIVLFTVIFRKFSRKAYRRVKEATTDINTFLSEHLSGMKIIQIFNREGKKMSQFADKNNTLYTAAKEQILVFSVFRPLVYMLYVSSVMCLFYFGCKSNFDSVGFMGTVITSELVVAFYMYTSKFFNPIQSLAEQFHRLQSAFASAEKIFTVYDIEPDVKDAPDAIELPTVRGEIEFKNVWFSYVPDEWVLKDVSFKIEAGQTAAFVGATGSGKTTILSLLARNYDVQEGEILLDGINVKHIKMSSLRKHFGQMLQDVFLFSGTVRSNIVLREDCFSDEQINEVCRYVNADKFISKLPNGLDEEVRERGNNFSAGQRQLLSFARTMIHRPEVMILDEATANIDTETELLIQDSLEKMMSVGTMLIVAHRLSTIQHADKIFVLSAGKILEQGTHDELLKKRGRYYNLYMLQYDEEKIKNQV